MRKLEKLFSKKNIVIITCYDATFASYLSDTDCDAILVGDSLGIVIKGESSTRKVTLNEVIYHTKAVKQGAHQIPIICDMPINTYNNKKVALKNAKLLVDAGADIVKIEGDNNILEIVKYLSINKIPVCGHIGYMPQLNTKLKSKNHNLLRKAKNLEEAGIKMLVLSMTKPSEDKSITQNLKIPTIGFRSSNFCNGEVEVLYDLLGITKLSFSKDKNKAKKIESVDIFSRLEKFIKKIHNRKIK
tara:strand:+ start:815 stop:1546 length:732 start_codon:yes stop_codon:yes gene_type:complete